MFPVLPVGTAQAVHETGQHGCPPPFTPYSAEEQLALAAENGVPESEVQETLDRLDRNDDGILCFMWLSWGPNIIENHAATQ